jgi:D-3-phosphoglycerate dehydrogenase
MTEKKRIVHTGAAPGEALPEEDSILAGLEDIEFVKRGRCRTPQQVLEAVQDADVGLCFGERYTREVFAGAPRLKAVLRYGVGVDTIDLEAATEHGVVVGHYPDFCTREVANHALVLMLCCAKRVAQMDRLLRREGWNAARELRSPMGCIHGQTLGLIAFGAIARELAKRAQCLEMEVIAYDPYVDAAVFEAAGVESVSLEALAERSDYVSCHAPLLDSTHGMVDAAFFGRMKASAFFINTSRGPVVNEPDLIAALQEGRIAGAGLDVFEREPMPADHPFLAMDQVVMTPHTASSADETMRLRNLRVGRDALAIARGGLPEFVANKAVLDHRRT